MLYLPQGDAGVTGGCHNHVIFLVGVKAPDFIFMTIQCFHTLVCFNCPEF